MAAPDSQYSSDQRLIAAAAVIMVALLGALGWMLYRPLPPRVVIAANSPAPAEPTDAAPSPPPAPAPAITAPKQPVHPAPVRARQRAAVPSAPVSPAAVVTDVPAKRDVAAAPAVVESAPPPAEPVARDVPPAAPTTAAVTYTSEDAGVNPPRAVSPQLLTMLSRSSPGLRPGVMTIAIIVNEQGTVDSVKATTLPINIGESVMLTAALSAAKAWHFRPAIKDGAPVKYRQIIPLRADGAGR